MYVATPKYKVISKINFAQKKTLWQLNSTVWDEYFLLQKVEAGVFGMHVWMDVLTSDCQA